MSNFNAVEVKDKCVEWIRDFFDKNGNEVPLLDKNGNEVPIEEKASTLSGN